MKIHKRIGSYFEALASVSFKLIIGLVLNIDILTAAKF